MIEREGRLTGTRSGYLKMIFFDSPSLSSIHHRQTLVNVNQYETNKIYMNSEKQKKKRKKKLTKCGFLLKRLDLSHGFVVLVMRQFGGVENDDGVFGRQRRWWSWNCNQSSETARNRINICVS